MEEWFQVHASGGDARKIVCQALTLEVNVCHVVCDVSLSSTFVNTSQSPLEAIFKFTNECTIYAFEAEVAGKRIVGVCKEKNEAFNQYDNAISAGKGAYLMESDKSSQFSMNLGNLLPKSTVTITLKYIAQLTAQDEKLCLDLPLAFAPSSLAQSKVKNNVKISVNIKMPTSIIKLTSPTHNKTIKEQKQTNPNEKSITCEYSAESKSDFVLLIDIANPHVPYVHTAVDPSSGTKNKMVGYFPDISTDTESTDMLCELIFLLDRSGSMGGSAIAQAANAMQIFLRSLPLGSKFNIYSFGSNYTALFPSSVTFDESSLATSSEFVARLDADMGGTQMLQPLQEILRLPVMPAYPRQLIIVTDGNVFEQVSSIYQLIKDGLGATRIFMLGIGDVDKTFVNNVARYGNGYTELVESKERIEPKVLAQLQRALMPLIKNVSVSWPSEKVTQTPRVRHSVFRNEVVVFYGEEDAAQQDGNTAVKYFNGDADSEAEPLRQEIKCVSVSSASGDDAILIARSYGASLLRDLEVQLKDAKSPEKEALETQIKKLGLQYGFVTSQTSYVGIEEHRDGATADNMVQETVVVDSKKTKSVFGKVKDAASSFFKSSSDVSQIDACFTSDTGTQSVNYGGGGDAFAGFTYSPDSPSSTTDRTSTFCGTPEYMAPEVLNGTAAPQATGNQQTIARNTGKGVSDYDLLSVIGKGSFGKIMQVRAKDGKIMAMKVSSKNLVIPAIPPHPFIVEVSNTFTSSQKIYIIMEYITGGELFFHLSRERKFSEEKTRFYAAEIVCALQHLHTHNLSFAALKPEDILLNSDGHIKISVPLAFGFGAKADWYNLGAIIYEMLTGLPPYYSHDVQLMYQQIQQGNLTFPAYVSENAKSLLTQLLSTEADKRPDYAEITTHPFFVSVDFSKLEKDPLSLPPPMVPQIRSSADISCIDSEFLREPPVDSLSNAIDNSDMFANFTFQPSGSTDPSYSTPSYSSSSYSSSSITSSYVTPTRKISEEHVRPVDRVVRTQKANGSFPLSDVLATIPDKGNEKSKESLSASKPAEVDDLLWGTAIALAILEKFFAATKNEWMLVAKKARKWAASNVGTHKWEDLLSLIKPLLKNLSL